MSGKPESLWLLRGVEFPSDNRFFADLRHVSAEMGEVYDSYQNLPDSPDGRVPERDALMQALFQMSQKTGRPSVREGLSRDYLFKKMGIKLFEEYGLGEMKVLQLDGGSEVLRCFTGGKADRLKMVSGQDARARLRRMERTVHLGGVPDGRRRMSYEILLKRLGLSVDGVLWKELFEYLFLDTNRLRWEEPDFIAQGPAIPRFLWNMGWNRLMPSAFEDLLFEVAAGQFPALRRQLKIWMELALFHGEISEILGLGTENERVRREVQNIRVNLQELDTSRSWLERLPFSAKSKLLAQRRAEFFDSHEQSSAVAQMTAYAYEFLDFLRRGHPYATHLLERANSYKAERDALGYIVLLCAFKKAMASGFGDLDGMMPPVDPADSAQNSLLPEGGAQGEALIVDRVQQSENLDRRMLDLADFKNLIETLLPEHRDHFSDAGRGGFG